jgi:hypothetical protein
MARREAMMLMWKETVGAVAHFKGYRYAITQSTDLDDEWEVEILDPDGGVVDEVFGSLEEAKRFCENTAAEVQE